MHDAGPLEQLQIAVGAALREAGLGVEDLGKGEWAAGSGQDVHERVARRRRALARPPQPHGHGVVERVERGHGRQV
jgi:hypothetical protein